MKLWTFFSRFWENCSFLDSYSKQDIWGRSSTTSWCKKFKLCGAGMLSASVVHVWSSQPLSLPTVFHTFIMLSFELYLKIVFLNNKVPLQWTSLFIIAIILYDYLLFGYFINMAACFSKTKFNPFLSPFRKICIVLKWYCLTYTRLGSSLAESSSQ